MVECVKFGLRQAKQVAHRVSWRTELTELCAISANHDLVDSHVVFVHGLSGSIEGTWTCSASGSTVVWPSWLAEDNLGVAVWLVEYQAARTNWGGYGTSIPDRADGILARLLAEPSLKRGDVIFVAHSLGGLIVEQVLRNAQREAGSDGRARDFLARVKRVAFLGTPHRGSIWATLAAKCGLLLRASDATRDLQSDNPLLKDLNRWYRRFSRENGIQNLLLVESRPERVLGVSLPKFFGRAVSEESADGGFHETPILVDESHSEICKPSSREANVYVLVREFVSRPHDNGLRVTRANEVLEGQIKELQSLRGSTDRQTAEIAELKNAIKRGALAGGSSTGLVDAEARRRLVRLRKCRTFPEFDAVEESRALAASMVEGELASASEEQKGNALAWCARILSSSAPDEAAEIVARVTVASDESHSIAHGFVKAAQGDLPGAIDDLCKLGTPVAFGAAYTCVLRANDAFDANSWLQKAGLSFADLDGDGKFNYVRMSLEAGEWDVAFEAAKEVTGEDCEVSPALYFATADAFLMRAVPEESRTYLLQQAVPFEAARFRLRGDPKALEHRRRAATLYARLHSFAVSSELPGLAGLMDDKALWLRLLDPASRAEAHEDLERSLRKQETFLRRLGFGLQFSVDIDLERAEREVDRQTELSGGNSPDAAVARFALALSQGSHAAVAKYIDVHRRQLMQHLAWKGVCLVEIEMLAKAGHLAKAEERLKEVIEKGLSERETVQLRLLLSEAGGGDPVAKRLAAYQKEKSIGNLSMLVAAYEEAQDWSNSCEYGKKLVEATGDLGDVRRYAFSLYNFERQEDALRVMEDFPGIWAEDEQLQLLRTQMQFECGRLEEARQSLRTLRKSSDSPEARQLQISLATVSGDWDSLQGFVEEEWSSRCDRTALDLLRAGQIAGHIGVARGEELVREAASRAGKDPEILAGCYHVASAAGWEDNIEVHRWIERAAELSDDDGPVQAVQLKDLVDKKPDWEERETNAWDLLEKGETPTFVAGKFLNRSLLSLNLMPALFNLNELDVRKRAMIPAFSGARGKAKAAPATVAMDATALISAEFLELLELYIEQFDAIMIPHDTLAWLLEERVRIQFHQPSLVVAARELRDMIAVGRLRAFEGSNFAPERLVSEVGAPLAALLAEASSEHSDNRQRLVVRGRPVHKAGSFMDEEADLKNYEAHLCSGIAVVDMLERKGLLTDPVARGARSALTAREGQWPTEPQIADGAMLYLDDLGSVASPAPGPAVQAASSRDQGVCVGQQNRGGGCADFLCRDGRRS